MKKILVPTDFSVNADKAFEYALQIARKVAGEIILLHVCSLPDPEYAVQPEGIRDYNQLKIAELSEQLARYQEMVNGKEWVSIRTLLVDGDAVDVIVEKAIAYDADLIVMGTRGAGALKALLFGTRTAAVMAASRIPVLAVPEAYDGGVPEKILLAVDREESPVLLRPLFRLREIFGATLNTMVFSDEDEPAVALVEHAETISRLTEKWKNTFAVNSMQSEHVLGEDFCNTVSSYLKAKDVNLLTLVTHRNRDLQQLFHRSQTRKMACYTRVPLLALHA
jgi:nucleotide-binding universal stress UspA family protein